MTGRHLCLAMAICAGLAGEAVATEPSGFAHDMHQLLLTRGPNRAIAELTASGDWARLIARISSGDVGVISLAPEIATGTDAGTSEELTISLAEALPKAPRDVLRVLTTDQNGTLSYARVCSAPFIEDSSRHQRSYKAAALRAVRRVMGSHEPELIIKSKHCIHELNKIKV